MVLLSLHVMGLYIPQAVAGCMRVACKSLFIINRPNIDVIIERHRTLEARPLLGMRRTEPAVEVTSHK